VGPSSQRKRKGERGLGEELGLRELGRARGKKERSGPREKQREGERGLGEELGLRELGRARGKKERSGPREKQRAARLLLGQLGWFRVFPIFLVSFPLSLSNQLKSI
jgi:hypothetical protein